MKILHVVGSSSYGGATVIVSRLAAWAHSSGWKVDVLLTDSMGVEDMGVEDIGVEEVRKTGANVIRLNCILRGIRPWSDVYGLFRFWRMLRASDYDVVHTHTSKAGFIGRLGAWLAGIPAVVHTVHGFPFHEESGFIERALYVFLERSAARWCDCIITVSECHRQLALAVCVDVSDRSISIPNGIPESRIVSHASRAAIRKSCGVSADEILILSTARLWPQKGVQFLIQAVGELATVPLDRPFKLLLAGTGPMSGSLAQLARRLNLGEKVRFLGFRSDVGDLLAACDIFVLPSLWEGLCLGLLEAMAAAKPIVATDIAGNSEATLGGQAAALVPSKDSAALAAAIRDLADHPEVAEALARKARTIYVSHFTEAAMLAGYRDVYRGLPRRLVRPHKSEDARR
jgi:glycosyltransferase involved in cell wall biosynthesis